MSLNFLKGSLTNTPSPKRLKWVPTSVPIKYLLPNNKQLISSDCPPHPLSILIIGPVHGGNCFQIAYNFGLATLDDAILLIYVYSKNVPIGRRAFCLQMELVSSEEHSIHSFKGTVRPD
jgi:hypothetical protein